MMHHFTKVCFLAAACAMSVQAAEGMKGLTFGGNVEAGFSTDFASSSSNIGSVKESQFMLDNLTVKMTADVSDKTKVVFNNSTAVDHGSAPAIGNALNSLTYYSGATLGGAGSQIQFSNTAAYVEHKLTDGISLAIGHFHSAFGMEGMWDRYDMKSYYYSSAYNVANAMGWNYDLGANVNIDNVLPGTLEVQLTDSHHGSTITPGLNARWHYEYKSGDWSLTPVASVLTSRWRGGPADLGISAGLLFKMGMIGVNAEWLYVSAKTDPTAVADAKFKAWSIKGEPSVDLGIVDITALIDYAHLDAGNGVTSNQVNFGAGVAHTYAEKFRVRLLYYHQNYAGGVPTGAAPAPGAGSAVDRGANEVRILFGTKW